MWAALAALSPAGSTWVKESAWLMRCFPSHTSPGCWCCWWLRQRTNPAGMETLQYLALGCNFRLELKCSLTQMNLILPSLNEPMFMSQCPVAACVFKSLKCCKNSPLKRKTMHSGSVLLTPTENRGTCYTPMQRIPDVDEWLWPFLLLKSEVWSLHVLMGDQRVVHHDKPATDAVSTPRAELLSVYLFIFFKLTNKHLRYEMWRQRSGAVCRLAVLFGSPAVSRCPANMPSALRRWTWNTQKVLVLLFTLLHFTHYFHCGWLSFSLCRWTCCTSWTFTK